MLQRRWPLAGVTSFLCLTRAAREFGQLLEALVGKRVRSEEEEEDEAFVRVLISTRPAARRVLPI